MVRGDRLHAARPVVAASTSAVVHVRAGVTFPAASCLKLAEGGVVMWMFWLTSGALSLGLAALLDVIAEWSAEARDWLQWTAYECAMRVGEL